MVEVDIADEALNLVEGSAPSRDYAFYVASGAVPQSAGELQKFGLVSCTDTGSGASVEASVRERAEAVASATGTSYFGVGRSTTACVENSVNPQTLVVTQRTTNPPSGVTEVVFK